MPVAVLFDIALPFVLKHEGGFSNDPDDPGGKTNYGVTQDTLTRVRAKDASLPKDVTDLTVDQAKRVYALGGYWIWDGIGNQGVATKLFDMAVNMGPHTAVALAQRAMNRLGVDLLADGILGPHTLIAINASDPMAVMGSLCVVSANHYKAIVDNHPVQVKWLKGWLSRAADVPPGVA